jgi:hypothetical protein
LVLVVSRAALMLVLLLAVRFMSPSVPREDKQVLWHSSCYTFIKIIIEFINRGSGDGVLFHIISKLCLGSSYIMATSFSGGRSQSTWREPPTRGKQLVNFITCGSESKNAFAQGLNKIGTHVIN